jgi:hypothetical protein
MTVVTLTRSRSDADYRADRAVIQDVVWALAEPAAGLEHIHVTTLGREIRVVLFLKAPTPDDARLAAIRLCAKACRDSPAFQGWEISA